MTDSDHPTYSGKAAEPEPIIDAIRSALERPEIDMDPDEVLANPGMSWDDPFDRQVVREAFDDDGAQEALPPGFGELGHAENAQDDCGNPHPLVCDTCLQAVEMGRTCGMSVCARCAPVWARDLGINKTAKLRRFRMEKDKMAPGLNQKRHHLVLSPPIEWYAALAQRVDRDRAQEITREVTKEILEELRAQGVLVRHSYRGENEDGSLAAETDDRGAWKSRQFNGRHWWNDVRKELAWKPHYHAVVISDWIELQGVELDESISELVQEATGWVIHRIQPYNGTSLEDDGDVARALTYCLSHADVEVDLEGTNQSAVWEVGAFQDEIFRSSDRFSARPHDYEWAEASVRRIAYKILGISSGTTDCGASIPGVDDPDRLAAKIIEKIFPGGAVDVEPDTVLEHVHDGNLTVDVSTSSGGGGDITVRDSAGRPVGADGFSVSSWSPAGDGQPTIAADTGSPATPGLRVDHGENDVDCSCGDDEHEPPERYQARECDGTLIPLESARKQGLLEDEELLEAAAHAEQALEADREWPDELEPWHGYEETPGSASPGIG